MELGRNSVATFGNCSTGSRVSVCFGLTYKEKKDQMQRYCRAAEPGLSLFAKVLGSFCTSESPVIAILY